MKFRFKRPKPPAAPPPQPARRFVDVGSGYWLTADLSPQQEATALQIAALALHAMDDEQRHRATALLLTLFLYHQEGTQYVQASIEELQRDFDAQQLQVIYGGVVLGAVSGLSKRAAAEARKGNVNCQT